MYNNLTKLSFIYGVLIAASSFAATDPIEQKPFYVGATGGFGSTTWKGLVPLEDQNMALTISTPIRVTEGGRIWGVFAGYEFTPYFAIEANFRRYPNAEVVFDQYSLYAFEHNEQISFKTNTDSMGLMAKIMLAVPQTTLRIYSSFGITTVHRMDIVFDQYQVGPTFGAGFNINISPHFMVDIGFNYTAGYGESELSPANSFIPFLYSGAIGLAYRI